MAFRNAQRVWINNTRYRDRPGVILEVETKYVKVMYPVSGCDALHDANFRASSLTVMQVYEYSVWIKKWENLIDGKYFFDEKQSGSGS